MFFPRVLAQPGQKPREYFPIRPGTISPREKGPNINGPSEKK